jgi:hypothetical protein
VARQAQTRDARRDPPSNSTSPPWDSMYGPHAGERLAHARLEVDRVEVVDEQEAGDDAVLDEPLVDLLPRPPASWSAATTRRSPSP